MLLLPPLRRARSVVARLLPIRRESHLMTILIRVPLLRRLRHRRRCRWWGSALATSRRRHRARVHRLPCHRGGRLPRRRMFPLLHREESREPRPIRLRNQRQTTQLQPSIGSRSNLMSEPHEAVTFLRRPLVLDRLLRRVPRSQPRSRIFGRLMLNKRRSTQMPAGRRAV